MITTSDPRVTYIDLQWPTVTYSDLQWPTVTLRWPILTLHTSSYLYLPHLIHTGLNHGDLEKYGGRKVVVVVVATEFNVKHQGKDIYHPPSTIYKWPLSDLPGLTPCPSLSLSFTILKSNIANMSEYSYRWRSFRKFIWDQIEDFTFPSPIKYICLLSSLLR